MKPYKVEYLPAAKQDMLEIVDYISRKLKNSQAADNLAEEMVAQAEKLGDFPYLNPAYYPVRPLKREYRKLLVKNYAMFYRIDEETKAVTIARVVYARRNYEVLLR